MLHKTVWLIFLTRIARRAIFFLTNHYLMKLCNAYKKTCYFSFLGYQQWRRQEANISPRKSQQNLISLSLFLNESSDFLGCTR